MCRLCALLVLAVWPAWARAEIEVDIELFLAVDVSRSMTARELEIQRRGYAAALSSDVVMAAVLNGMIGRIALTYVEWAGDNSQTVIVPWTLIESQQDAVQVASQLTASFGMGMRRTSISGAIDYAAQSFDDNGFAGLRRVVDISGDGPNNHGRPVLEARDLALSRGIIINGLPLMTRDGLGSQWHLEDLDRYYEACVIGGPASFVVPVREWVQFPAAVTKKLVLEIAGLQPRLFAAQYRAAEPYDCMIGEKIWQRNRDYYSEP